jgi:hypothetical protein
MKQLRLVDTSLQCLAGEMPKAPARDPETAESLHQYCQLFRLKYGDYPDAGRQLEALNRHKWPEDYGRRRR